MRNPEHLKAIRRLNDAAREQPGITSRATASLGFGSMPEQDRDAALAAIIKFSRFKANNDPFEEHDFGTIFQTSSGEWTECRPKDEAEIVSTVLWKIDLYDPGLVKVALNGSFC